MGKLMKKFLIVTVSTLGFAGAAVAADLPVRQPPPPTPVVGKAPIGKAPIGKAPIGKAPIGKGPMVAPGPIVTRG
jgi:opacity protein-like surface antigen